MGEMVSPALVLHLLLILLCLAVMSTADSPIQCDSAGGSCTVQNFQGIWNDRSTCKVAKVVCPSTEADLIRAVAEAVKMKQKIKVVSKLSHSIPKLVCPGGDSGVVISTASYNKHIVIDKEAMTVTVDAGVLLKDMLKTIAQAGYAFPYTTTWNGVSVSGMISTGAHGSSLWDKGGNINEYVVGMSLVVPASAEEGYAKLIYLNSSNPDLKAAMLSLGVLGAISQITFAIQPLFKRSLTKVLESDEGLEDRLLSLAMAHEFADVTWFPSIRKVMLRLEDRVAVSTPGEGISTESGPATVEGATRSKLYVYEILATRNVTQMQIDSINKLDRRVSGGDGYLNDGKNFTGYPVVGYSYLMQTAGACLNIPGGDYESKGCYNSPSRNKTHFCAWDPRTNGSIRYFISFGVGFSNTKSFISDVKKLREANPESMWGIDFYNGINIRFVNKSSAYLGNKEDGISLNFWHEHYRQANVPIFHEDVVEELEQMLIHKYAGTPHYGKNRNVAFMDIASSTNDLPKFLEVKGRMDPEGLFSSEWSDAVLGIGNANSTAVADYCAVEGLCVCQEDRHCAPDKGFFCRPGKVFTDARVCHFEG